MRRTLRTWHNSWAMSNDALPPVSDLRVLIVEDNHVDRVLAQEAFEELAPTVEVNAVDSGEAALAHLRDPARTRPHVILLDINMPGLDGFDVLRALKADLNLWHIPVVMLSTSAAEADVARAYSLHASAYLTKAPAFGDFLELVEGFMQHWLRARFARTRASG